VVEAGRAAGVANVLRGWRSHRGATKAASNLGRACAAAEDIRVRFGLKAAFDYLVGARLLNLQRLPLRPRLRTRTAAIRRRSMRHVRER
jgi:hypothetical protein